MEALQTRILQKDRNESNWYYYVMNHVEEEMNGIKKPTIKKKLVKQAFFLFFDKNKIILLTKRV